MIQRLDKYLSDAGLGTRNEIKHLIYSKRITVDKNIVRDPSLKKDFDNCAVEFDGNPVESCHTVICAIYKPQGYVTSTDDPISPTVMEFIPQQFQNIGVVPIGRLDKDTEGILLFTNDGNLLHRLISPKSNVEKTYIAEFEGLCPPTAKEDFKKGIVLKDGTVCKSAEFDKLSDTSFCLTITEGMYHQVKRMAAAEGMHITHLKRISFAGINCDGMQEGQFKVLEDFTF